MRNKGAVALAGGVSMWALMAAAAAAADDTVEELVVTAPIVGAQQAAVAQQRNADNLISVIAADTVGQFPDQNSAAALARLPSVAVQRDQGQERYLQIRGAPNRWTSVSVDGINIIGVDEGGTQRAFRFDAVPAVILRALEVNKSITPDLPADAIVARVNLRTFSPFDQAGFAFQGDAGLGRMELGDGDQRQFAARASWSGERFGVIAGASHYLREQVTDNREFAYDAAGLPTTIDVRNYLVDRESNGGILGLEFRPADGHRLFAKSIYTEFKDNERRNQYVFQIGSALSGTRGADAGDLVGVPVRATVNDAYYDNSNWINTLGGDHEDVAGWRLEWRINYTETENGTDLPLVMAQQTAANQRISLRYDRSDVNLPILSLATTAPGAASGSFVRGAPVAALTGANFPLALYLPYAGVTRSEAMVYKADAARTFVLGGRDVELKLGLQYDDRDVDGTLLGAGSTTVLTQLLPRVGRSLNYGDYITDKPWETGFPSGFAPTYIDNKRLRADLDSALAALQAAGLYTPPAQGGPNAYQIGEKLLAGYGSAKFDLGPAQIVAGLRVEWMEQTIDGFLSAGAALTRVSVSTTDTDLFPSINARIELQEDLLLRLAVQTGISRPSFGVVRAGASINDVSQIVSGGNPTLEPEKTLGFDVSLERYLPGSGVVSASAFYRAVDKVLYEATTRVEGDLYDTPGVDRTGYQYATTLNGDEGKLYGLELAYQQQFVFLPGPFDGFGFQGSVTFLDGQFETGDGRKEDFPGTSKTITNASLYYENHGLSVRISHQWRDDWIDTLNSLGSGEFRKAYESVDLSVRYAVNEQVSVYLDANNLTDETYVAYEGDVSHPSEVEQIGRRWMAGVRVSF
ncbi:TonB-dependent receptor [Phenylobacterium sp.]|uniref:TonB-dependent receptor n=1 Tax=Phenylobacterium sp. TaxID=1871053 RepID=UPI0035B120C9